MDGFPAEVTGVKLSKRTTSYILYLLMHPRRAFECLAMALYFDLKIAIHCHLLDAFLQQNKTKRMRTNFYRALPLVS